GGAGPGCGAGSGSCANGSVYDPIADSWKAMSSTGTPAPRASHVAVWADDRMVIWGGLTGDLQYPLDDGAEYFP
ncbi:MAG TPA: kelch repeat-containing protein, partial [Polyangiaceae bacterium]|nr:kelch repeat-containing protein [Polyangiaceae bacterium]